MEGLTDIKIDILCRVMKQRALDFICLQETRVWSSGSQILEGGYVLITSGEDDDKRTHAGVGFIVSPRLTRSIYSFKAISERREGDLLQRTRPHIGSSISQSSGMYL